MMLRLLASLLVLPLYSSSRNGVVVDAQPTLLDVTFGQLDWYDPRNETEILVIPNSVWGTINWDYTPDNNNETYYLNFNLALEPGKGSVWVVQNLPLFPVQAEDDNGSNRREGVYFSLTELNVTEGVNVTELYYSASISPDFEITDPGPVGQVPQVVETLDLIQSDGTEDFPTPNDEPLDPGEPLGPKLEGKVDREYNKDRKITEVQEGKDKCMAGSFARSLEWLDRECKLGVGKSAKKIYEELLEAKVSNKSNRAGNDEWIERKNVYAKQFSNNRIVTKVWEYRHDTVDSTDGVDQVDQSTQHFTTWLTREMSNDCDVELSYCIGNKNCHIMTLQKLYSVKDTNGKDVYYVDYRDDETQGTKGVFGPGKKNEDKGDKKVKRGAKIFAKDGKWRFGDGTKHKKEIRFAVSECCVSAPTRSAPMAPIESPVPTPVPSIESTTTPGGGNGGGGDICVVLKCCEEDCCGAGTMYAASTGLCEATQGSGGWTGSHSSTHKLGCHLRTCCEEACCALGTVWNTGSSLCIGA